MRLAFIAFPRYLASAKITGFNDTLVLTPAFAERGVTLDLVDGFSATIDWRQYDAVLPLGCWGYFKDPAGFRDFIARLTGLGVRLINPPEILLWNMDKSYLLDLRAAGVAVAPLVHFPQGATPDLEAELARVGWSRFVIKPTISANAGQTLVGEGPPSEEVLALSRQILAHSGMLLQPFFEEIPRHGEWSLLFCGDTLIHSLVKLPKPGDFRSQPDHGASVTRAEPSPQMLQQARAALAAAPRPPAYARVDGFLHKGFFEIIELELIEPSLFLASADPSAAGKFCDAILGPRGLAVAR